MVGTTGVRDFCAKVSEVCMGVINFVIINFVTYKLCDI
jgi:hypothetical protein